MLKFIQQKNFINEAYIFWKIFLIKLNLFK